MPSPSYILYILCINLLVLQLLGQSQCFTPGVGTALTFYTGAQTTSAKSSSIAQLTCNGGNGCKYSTEVETVQCSCTGIDDFENPQWKCQSDLPNDLKLGKILVSCESCTTFNDQQMLMGSCGLYYNLNYNANGAFDEDHHTANDYGSFENFLLSFIEGVILVIVGIIIIAGCVACCEMSNSRYERLPLRNDSFRDIEAVAIPVHSNTIPSAPPIRVMHTQRVYQQPANTYTSYQNPPRQDNSSFVNGMLVGEMVGGGRRENHLAEDILLMNAISGSSSGNNFTTGLLMGEILNSGNNKHHKPPVHNKHHHQHISTPSYGGDDSVSIGFGGTMRR